MKKVALVKDLEELNLQLSALNVLLNNSPIKIRFYKRCIELLEYIFTKKTEGTKSYHSVHI